jgi:23S rRNA pseudouridine1911/1915/1917 synthase
VNETHHHIDTNFPPGRLDGVLATRLEDLSRNRIQKLIREGRVRVNGQVIIKPSYRLNGDELLDIQIPKVRETEITPEKIPLEVIYEDPNLIVINKAAGMVVHPSAGHQTGTLVNAILAHSPDIEGVGGVKRPGIVHRLDKDTSGIILVAKNDLSHQFLQDQFSSRSVEKIYLTLVDGVPKSATGKIDAAIGRSKRDRKKMAVFPEGRGRDAVTFYKVLEWFDQYSYLEVRPKTGRTHQIRVHLAFIGNPVAGDRVYGRKKPSLTLKRQFLHAAEVHIMIPGLSEMQTYKSPLPPDLESSLENLRRAGRIPENSNGY